MKLNIKGDIIQWNDSIIEFQDAMKTIDENEDLEINVSSLGGDVFLGLDIANTIQGHKGNTTVTITGIAASAASIISVAADKVKMFKSSQMMIHNAFTLAMGGSEDLRKAADTLDKIGESIIASYSHRVNEDKAKELMDAETFMTASEAVELGFADEVINANPEKVESKAFAELAKEFNDKIEVSEPKKPKVSVSIDSKELQEMLADFKEEIKNELKPNTQQTQEPVQEPVQNSNLSKLFLNL